MLKFTLTFAVLLIASFLYYAFNGFCFSEETVSMLACMEGSNCPPVCTGSGWIAHIVAAIGAIGFIVTLGRFAFRKVFRS